MTEPKLESLEDISIREAVRMMRQIKWTLFAAAAVFFTLGAVITAAIIWGN